MHKQEIDYFMVTLTMTVASFLSGFQSGHVRAMLLLYSVQSKHHGAAACLGIILKDHQSLDSEL